uniref:Putative secreted protein n=1 Tax=Amblyomma triste TaxID=251400 RepID=A0A023G2J6_AMBTT
MKHFLQAPALAPPRRSGKTYLFPTLIAALVLPLLVIAQACRDRKTRKEKKESTSCYFPQGTFLCVFPDVLLTGSIWHLQGVHKAKQAYKTGFLETGSLRAIGPSPHIHNTFPCPQANNRARKCGCTVVTASSPARRDSEGSSRSCCMKRRLNGLHVNA